MDALERGEVHGCATRDATIAHEDAHRDGRKASTRFDGGGARDDARTIGTRARGRTRGRGKTRGGAGEGRAGVEARAEGREGDARGETEIRDRASDGDGARDGNRRRGDDGGGWDETRVAMRD